MASLYHQRTEFTAGDHTESSSGTCQFLHAPALPRRSAAGRARWRRHRAGRGNAASAADRRNRSSTFDDVAGVLPGTPTTRTPACRGRNKGMSTVSRRTHAGSPKGHTSHQLTKRLDSAGIWLPVAVGVVDEIHWRFDYYGMLRLSLSSRGDRES